MLTVINSKVYVLRAKIGQRHSNDLIDLTIIDENIKIGNGRSDSVCRSVIECDPAVTTGVELVARGRSVGRAGPVHDQRTGSSRQLSLSSPGNLFIC